MLLLQCWGCQKPVLGALVPSRPIRMGGSNGGGVAGSLTSLILLIFYSYIKLYTPFIIGPTSGFARMASLIGELGKNPTKFVDQLTLGELSWRGVKFCAGVRVGWYGWCHVQTIVCFKTIRLYVIECKLEIAASCRWILAQIHTPGGIKKRRTLSQSMRYLKLN